MKYTVIMLLFLGAVAEVTYAQVTDTTKTDSIQLSPSAKTMKRVTISANKPLYAVDGEKQLYNTAEDPSVQTGTASDALQNAPGVEVDAEGNITLGGSQGVEVWINDRPSNLSGESLRQYIKTLPTNAIERIEVITNPSARYGG
ncbi:MAG: Plug domain-containing protein [Bacteroidales bacterium]|nr:Plug domain-containing protein [Bacteroidales bacterium]MBQ7711736.1 Plug domain-containing protein [Bacteroidales bacterium]